MLVLEQEGHRHEDQNQDGSAPDNARRSFHRIEGVVRSRLHHLFQLLWPRQRDRRHRCAGQWRHQRNGLGIPKRATAASLTEWPLRTGVWPIAKARRLSLDARPRRLTVGAVSL